MQEDRKARFPIGTQYRDRKDKNVLWTVTDILKTYNHQGTLVSIRYVAERPYVGQSLRDYDVVDPTIARNLVGNYL